MRLSKFFTIALLVTSVMWCHESEARRRSTTIQKPTVTKDDGSGKPASKSDEEAAAEIYSDQRVRDLGQTLADRIKAVTSQVFQRRYRFSIGPQISGSLNDPFYQNIMVGLKAGFNIGDSFYLGLSGEYTPINSVSTIVRVLGREQSRPEYYRPLYFAYLSGAWAPIYGKLSVMAEKVIHFDTFVKAGVGIAAMSSGRDDVVDPPMSVSGLFGIGGNFYLNRWVAIRWEIADRLIYGSRYIALIPGSEEGLLQHFICATIGTDFYFPRNP